MTGPGDDKDETNEAARSELLTLELAGGSDGAASPQRFAIETEAVCDLPDGTAELLSRCRALCDCWEADLRRAPELFGPALAAFLDRYQSLPSDEARLASLERFGTGLAAETEQPAAMVMAMVDSEYREGGKRPASPDIPGEDGGAGEHDVFQAAPKLAKLQNAQVIAPDGEPYYVLEQIENVDRGSSDV